MAIGRCVLFVTVLLVCIVIPSSMSLLVPRFMERYLRGRGGGTTRLARPIQVFNDSLMRFVGKAALLLTRSSSFPRQCSC